jgi:DNA polymerase
MKAEDKRILAGFLDLTADYLRDGYTRDRQTPEFADSSAEKSAEESVEESSSPRGDFSSLPLAYQVDEFEDSDELKDSNESKDSFEAIAADIAACKACGLAATRTLVVPGEGAERPLVMVIGEGPGADEDRAGRPFVGKAGQLLDKMLQSIELFRNKNCFIGNMVKCRPPENRDPRPEEIDACFPYLERQIALLCPRIILCAGRVAAQSLLKTSAGINALRGEFREIKIAETVIPVLCTFHPSALLRSESLKRPAWEDLKLLKSHLDKQNFGKN